MSYLVLSWPMRHPANKKFSRHKTHSGVVKSNDGLGKFTAPLTNCFFVQLDAASELVERDPLIGRVSLGDVAWADHHELFQFSELSAIGAIANGLRFPTSQLAHRANTRGIGVDPYVPATVVAFEFETEFFSPLASGFDQIFTVNLGHCSQADPSVRASGSDVDRGRPITNAKVPGQRGWIESCVVILNVILRPLSKLSNQREHRNHRNV